MDARGLKVSQNQKAQTPSAAHWAKADQRMGASVNLLEFVPDSNEDQSESLGFQGGKACPEIPTGCLPSCFLGQVTAFIGEEGEGDWLARPLGDPMPETLACPTSGYNNLTTHKFRLVQCPYDPLTLTLSCSSLK